MLNRISTYFQVSVYRTSALIFYYFHIHYILYTMHPPYQLVQHMQPPHTSEHLQMIKTPLMSLLISLSADFSIHGGSGKEFMQISRTNYILLKYAVTCLGLFWKEPNLFKQINNLHVKPSNPMVITTAYVSKFSLGYLNSCCMFETRLVLSMGPVAFQVSNVLVHNMRLFCAS